MRRTKSFLLSSAILLLCCCTVGNGRKPLVGGINGKENAANASEETAIEKSVSSGKPNEDYGEGIEIPAPIANAPEQILHREGYTVSYNSATKLPNWVAWHLTADHCVGTVERPRKAFHEDEDVAEPRATDWDYYNSGYDRGHMCPAGDNKWSREAMSQSFLFTNICPQNNNLNRGDWGEMEKACRKWAQEYGDIYIVCGPVLYKGKHKTIGKNKVVVPEAFFKVILCMHGTPKAIGFIYKNEAGDRPKGDYANTVDQVERITGYDFFPSLPDDVEQRIESESNPEDWDI